MKTFWCTILILLVAVQSFGKWLVLLDFSINQEYIALNLCENRAKPELKCGGKCQLGKKLAAEEQQNKDGGTTAKVKFAEVLFDLPLYVQPSSPSNSEAQPQNGRYQLLLYAAPQPAPFHPPTIA